MMRTLRLLLLAALAIYPMVVIAAAVRAGIALSPDSVSYLSTARSFGAGAGLVAFDGQPLTLFPPGLPILLGLGEAAGGSAEGVAAVLNVVLAGAVVLGTYWLGRMALRSPWLALGSAAVVSLSAAFVGVSFWLWTEPLFTALTLCVLLILARGVLRGTAPWWFVLASALLVALAETVRYVGYVLIPVIALGLWWAAEGHSKRTRWVRSAVGVGISVLVPVGLAMRNVGLGHGPLGDRYPGVRTLQDAFGESARVLGEFVLPPEASTLAPVIGVLIGVLIAIGIWVGLVQRDRVAGLLGAFVLLYVSAIVWSQTATRLDAPSARLLAPALPALAILATAGLRALGQRVVVGAGLWASGSARPTVRQHGQSLVVGLIGVLALVVVLGALTASLRAEQRDVAAAQAGSLGLARAAQTSPLVAAAAALPDAAGFASNDPWTLYMGVNVIPVAPLPPSEEEWPDARIKRDREDLGRAVRAGRISHAVVVADGNAIAPLSDLASLGITVTLVGDLPEGRLYRLTASGE